MADLRLDASGVLQRVGALRAQHGVDALREEYVVTNGAALALRGLRPAHDVDLLVDGGLWDRLSAYGWRLRYWPSPASVGELISPDGDMIAYRDLTIAGAPLSFVVAARGSDLVKGEPTISMPLLRSWKRASDRPLDRADVPLIETFMRER